MFDRSCTRFHDKTMQKSGSTFRRAESFYYREIRSSMVRKYEKNKDRKSYGSAAMSKHIDYWTDDYIPSGINSSIHINVYLNTKTNVCHLKGIY